MKKNIFFKKSMMNSKQQYIASFIGAVLLTIPLLVSGFLFLIHKIDTTDIILGVMSIMFAYIGLLAMCILYIGILCGVCHRME